MKDFNVDAFLKDCETCCFDCGVSSRAKPLHIIEKGVALCGRCLRTAKEDYPKGD